MSEPTEQEYYAQMAAQAAEMASIEVVTWVPVNIDDHVCGRIIETGTIELPSLKPGGDIDIWPTNTIVPIGDVVMEGKKLNLDKKVLRLAWLGPVQMSCYSRTRPTTDDVVAMHYQSDQTPRSGLNDYKLVNCIVFDHTTGKVKEPQNVALTHSVQPLGSGHVTAINVGESPLTPRENEPSF